MKDAAPGNTKARASSPSATFHDAGSAPSRGPDAVFFPRAITPSSNTFAMPVPARTRSANEGQQSFSRREGPSRRRTSGTGTGSPLRVVATTSWNPQQTGAPSLLTTRKHQRVVSVSGSSCESRIPTFSPTGTGARFRV